MMSRGRNGIEAATMARRALLLALVALTWACADDDTTSTATSVISSSNTTGNGGAGGNGGVGGAGGAGGSIGGAPCHDLLNDGSVVPVIAVDENVPPPEGGAVADGVYVLTQLDWNTGPGGYTGPHPNGSAVQSKLRISGDTAELVYRITRADGYEEEVNLAATLMAQRTSLVLTHTCFSCAINTGAPCDDPQTQTLPYTASATTLQVLAPENVWTYTRQP